jgi:SAM-dependent methyltransferase
MFVPSPVRERNGLANRHRVEGRTAQYLWADPLKLERQSLYDSLRTVAGVADGRLLDLGCGYKPYRELFRQRVAHHIGVDLSTEGSAPDVLASGFALPFIDACFETVLATQVLEHVPEPELLLREVARVLRPGGVLILTAPLTWPLHEEPFDYFRYTEYGLRYLLEKCGYRVEHLQQRLGGLGTLGQLAALFLGHRVSLLTKRGNRQWSRLLRQAIRGVQRLGLTLDARWPMRELTLGYTVVARQGTASDVSGTKAP